MTEEHDSLVSDERVEEKDDGMCKHPARMKMRMVRTIHIERIRHRKGLNEFNERVLNSSQALVTD